MPFFIEKKGGGGWKPEPDFTQQFSSLALATAVTAWFVSFTFKIFLQASQLLI